MKELRVLHVNDAAGQGWFLSRAQRKLGLKTDLILTGEPRFGYKYDFNFYYSPSLLRKFSLYSKLPILLKKQLFDYDIFHFYSRYTRFFSNKLAFLDFDIKIWKALNKKIIIHFLGTDARQLDLAEKYKFHYAKELGFDSKREKNKRAMVEWYRSFADLLLVGDYELNEYVKGATVLPVTYDKDFIQTLPVKFSSENTIKIVHSPSNRTIKGSEKIITTVERLINENNDLNIEFNLIEDVDHKEALKTYAEADICIDQIRLGSYGTFAVESMALGKPVVSYIRSDLISNYPDLPIVSANEENLFDELKKLILDRSLRRNLGEAGKKYVDKRHDPIKVAQESVQLYKKVLEK